MLSTDRNTAALRVNANRAGRAIDALSAVADLCAEAGTISPNAGLHHVNADHLGSLLGLIVDELRAAHNSN